MKSGAINHSRFRLIREIIDRSEADNWQEARLEWRLADIYFADSDDPGTCLCSHFPIIEHCVLRNRLNAARVEVGNVCVTRFMGINSNRVFRCLSRIMEDDSRAMNPDTIEFAFAKGLLSDWEREFSLDTWRIRKLSSRQAGKRVEINRMVLQHICRQEVVR